MACGARASRSAARWVACSTSCSNGLAIAPSLYHSLCPSPCRRTLARSIGRPGVRSVKLCGSQNGLPAGAPIMSQERLNQAREQLRQEFIQYVEAIGSSRRLSTEDDPAGALPYGRRGGRPRGVSLDGALRPTVLVGRPTCPPASRRRPGVALRFGRPWRSPSRAYFGHPFRN
jgi:hypothetical protein